MFAVSEVESALSVMRNLSVEQGETRVASNYLFSHFLCLNPAHMQMRDTKRVAACMRRLGWDGPKVLSINGKDVKGYRKPLPPRTINAPDVVPMVVVETPKSSTEPLKPSPVRTEVDKESAEILTKIMKRDGSYDETLKKMREAAVREEQTKS
jgi:hypothetical protein